MSDGFTRFKLGQEAPEVPLSPPTFHLEVELVPASSWGANLRSALRANEWDRLRKQTYRLAGYRCEICGGKGAKHPVECHEVWAYEDVQGNVPDIVDYSRTYTQTLVRLVSLCPACHEVKHFGLTTLRGRDQQAFRHLMRVNGWNENQAQKHIQEVYALWEKRSRVGWMLDLSWLEENGVALHEVSVDELSQLGPWED